MQAKQKAPLEQIKASAGAGKTYKITQTFLNLLKQSNDQAPSPCAKRAGGAGSFSEILAVTFTNRAAAEMKGRVLQDLKELALGLKENGAPQPLTAQEAATWVNTLLQRYDSFNIRTIDSLLTMLARLSALELGLPPDFEPNFDKDSYPLPLYEAWLEKAAIEGGPEALALAKACECLVDFDSKGFSAGKALRENVIMLLNFLMENCPTAPDSPDYPYSPDSPGTLNAPLPLPPLPPAEKLAAMYEDRLDQVRCTSAQLRQVLGQEGFKVNKKLLDLLEKCQNPKQLLDADHISTFEDKISLQACLNSGSCPASEADEGVYLAFKQACAALRQDCPLLHDARKLLPMARIAAELLPALQELFALSGQVPGAQIPRLAAQALDEENGMGVSEACCRLGSRLRHLLIDEFQDTSQLQWDAVQPLARECLSQGGSLTYVGDVKQAIYNWRGGDSALFDKIADDEELKPIITDRFPTPTSLASYTTLKENWRSAPAIVRHNNAFFKRLAPEQAGQPELAVQPEQAESGKKSGPGHNNASNRDIAPSELGRAVMAKLLPKSTPPQIVEEGARQLARTFYECEQGIPAKRPQKPEGLVKLYRLQREYMPGLREGIAEKLQELFADFKTRFRPGDIAVLVRNNNEATTVSELLLKEGWPVLTENSLHLNRLPLVTRLISLLSFLDYPLDDLAFREFITGPECFARPCGQGGSGLAPQELEEWLAQTQLDDAGQPLFRRFKQAFPQLWARFLEPFYSQAGLMSAYDTLSEIYRRYELLKYNAEDAVFLRRLLEVAHLAETQGHSSLAGFLNYWRENGAAERTPTPENLNAVRVMTIHKAKGLEFPVVVLPYLIFQNLPDSSLTVAELDGVPFIAHSRYWRGPDFYLNKIRDVLEDLNLLYVAFTRPSKELHAIISATARQTPFSAALELMTQDFDLKEDGDTYSYGENWEPQYQPGETLAGMNAPAPDMPDKPARPDATGGTGGPGGTDTLGITGGPEDFGPGWRPMNWLPRLKISSEPLRSPGLSFASGPAIATVGPAIAPVDPAARPAPPAPVGPATGKSLAGSRAEESAEKRAARGTFLHNCLEMLANRLTAHGEAGKQAVSENFKEQLVLMARNFLPWADARQEAQAAMDIMEWFISRPGALRQLRDGRPEQSLLTAEGDTLRVDLLVDEGEKGLLVIDYKSGQPSPDYAKKMRSYKEALAGACHRPVRAELVYLDARKVEEC